MGTHREVALDGSRLDILLPLHLVSDSALMDNMGGQIQLDTSYACGYDGLKEGETLAALFRAYYEESGLYTVTSSDGGFTIVPKGSDKTLIFTFQEDGTSGMFAVSVPVETEPEPTSAASIRYEQGEAVQLPEQDAIALSEIIVNASYRQTEPMDDITPYEVDMEGTTYRISLTWSTDTWSATVRGDSGVATLTTKDACMVAAIIGANDAGGVPARDDASWFGDLSADFSAAAAQMVTTGDINVRSAPSTSSTVLMTMPQDSSVAVIGISDFAQHALGDVVFVNLPGEGDEVTAGEAFGDVESVKAVSDLVSPVSGTVCAVNEELLDAPELLNSQCYDAWIIKVEGVTATEELLDADGYEAFCQQEG